MRWFFPGGIFSILIWGLILLALIYLAVKLIRAIRENQTGKERDRNDSLEILKRRFAKGEINEDEYIRMKSILLKSSKYE